VIRAVLFDLDGTLLDSAPDLIGTLNYLRAGLNLAAMPEDDLRHFVSRGATGLIRAGMPPCDDETLLKWKDAFISHYKDNIFNQSRPFDGVEDLLKELTARSIPWGVVTNKMESLCVPILEKVGWLPSLSALVCGDTISSSRPDPGLILEACNSIGITPGDALMVGDDLRDVKAGTLAGCQTAFAAYGYADKESRAELTAGTNLIGDPGQILALLDASGSD